MKHAKIIALTIATLLCTIPIYARTLTPEEALQRATLFAPGISSRSGHIEFQLAHTAEPHSDSAPVPYYVFNQIDNGNKGFIIVSGDDRLRPVLALTQNGTFDLNNVPDALKWLLESYQNDSKSLHRATGNPVNYTTSRSSQSITAPSDNYKKWKSIAPLLSTKWDQSEPFNNLCPLFGFSDDRTPAGCVAIAFAQIINYHKFADLSKYAGQTKSYSTRFVTASYTFPEKFDFDNMLDAYTFNYQDWQTIVPNFNEKEADAVAQLVKACGVIIETDYRTGIGSSAITTKTSSAAVEYFGYDPSSVSTTRAGMQTSEWEKCIYNELSNKRPVLYSGQSSEIGHAFVCDGYLYDGLFHINWGWSGDWDGYYALSALNPDDPNSDNFDNGYNGSQEIALFVKPTDKNKPNLPKHKVNLSENPEYLEKTAWGTPGIKISFGLEGTPAGHGEVMYGAFLQRITDDINDLKIEKIIGQHKTVDINVGYYYSNFSISIPNDSLINLPKGDYEITIVFKINGENMDWLPMTPTTGGTNKIILSVDAFGNRTFQTAEPDYKYSLEVSSFTPMEEIFLDDMIMADLLLTNRGNSDFTGCIVGTLENDESQETFFITKSSLIFPNQTTKIPFAYKLKHLTEGQYTLRVGELINGKINNGRVMSGILNYFDGIFNVTVNAGHNPNSIFPNVPIKAISAASISKEFVPGQTITCPVKFLSNGRGSVRLACKLISHITKEEIFPMEEGYLYFDDLPSGISSLMKLELGKIPQNLIPGIYDFVLCDIELEDYNISSNVEISQRIPISVGTILDGIVYQFSSSENELVASSISDTSKDEFAIHESIQVGENSYTVTAVAKNLFAQNNSVSIVHIPSSISEIGDSAFFNSPNLRHVLFYGDQNPITNPSNTFLHTHPDLSIYVPDYAFSDYEELEQLGNLYALIHKLRASEDKVRIDIGESKTIKIICEPNDKVNPVFIVTTTNEKVKTIFNNGLLTISGVEQGNTTILIESAQPGIDILHLEVMVGNEPTDPFDITGDGNVDVTDVVNIVDKIIHKTTEVAFHDLNNDGKVDVADIVVLVSHILNGSGNSTASRSAKAVDVPVSFDMSTSYTAMQTDIVVAEGSAIEDVAINAAIARSHTLAYNEIEPGRYRVIVYSPANRTMALEAGEPLFTLSVAGSDTVATEATLFVEAEVVPTGINGITDSAAVESVTYFDLQGRRVSSEARGILIERTVLTDGTVVNRKIRR